MAFTVDLDAYFARTGYSGSRLPTPDTLRAIVLCHVQAIPFENLNPLVGWPVDLDLPALERKLVHERRGGYCYELNLLLAHVLTVLGFSVAGMSARVLWNLPDDVASPRTHMLLRVELDGRQFVVDAGFGSMTLTAPLELSSEDSQSTPHEQFRLRRAGEDFSLEVQLRGTWKPIYRFDLREQLLPDYEVSNWYMSTHPRSSLVNEFVVGLPAVGCRHTLRNNVLTTRDLGGVAVRRVLPTALALRVVLGTVFRIELPNSRDVDIALERVVARASDTRDTRDTNENQP
ncbi:MAG: arylamine N-acetyltransferase family protein [Gemmatimonadaceae bacterium]